MLKINNLIGAIIIVPSGGISDEAKQMILNLLFFCLFVACLSWWVKVITKFLIFLFKVIKNIFNKISKKKYVVKSFCVRKP